jgi:NO-binding membrane sensor protein with MHYT domain
MLPVHNFQYGLLTPIAAYLLSCLGAFLGLRCTTRALAYEGVARARWLALAAVSMGAMGIWVMHFVAMLGFAIPGETIRYDVQGTLLAMLVAVVVMGAGLFIVGFAPQSWRTLVVAGAITGIGVASVHYTAMAAMRMPARMTYNPVLFALSGLIGIVIAIGVFWAALRLHAILPTIGAALIMGAAVCGMHYTGMAAMHVLPPSMSTSMSASMSSGATVTGFLLPLIGGITLVVFVLIATIGMSPTAQEIRDEAALLEQSRARGLEV